MQLRWRFSPQLQAGVGAGVHAAELAVTQHVAAGKIKKSTPSLIIWIHPGLEH
jgi:hypothetical protein